MFRRFMSHVLIGLAVFCLTSTFFVWVIDAAVLSPTKLVPALRSAGLPSAIASALPDMATKDNKDASPAELADMRAKIAEVVTPAYIDQKLQKIVETFTEYIHNGSPQPTLDLSDFPQKLRDAGVIKPGEGSDIDKNFKDPINLNKDGKLNKLPDAYKTLKLLKYAGAVLFVLLLLAEWFVAEKGKKLQRAGRIFLHAGLWYGLYFVLLIVIPAKFLPKLKENVSDENAKIVLSDFVKGIQTLFGVYFVGFAVACLVIALALYIARHAHKHVNVIKEHGNVPPTPAPQTSANTAIKPARSTNKPTKK